MPTFTGTLNANEIYSSLYNMIISQEVFADRLDGGAGLVDEARVDGGLHGDTKLFYSADILKTHAWGADSEAPNLLALDRPNSPECQAVTLDQFRQIRLTLDDYMSKRAWGTEGAFGQFNSIMESMLSKTKEIYDESTYNVFIGTTVSNVGRQSQSVEIHDDTPEDRAKKIAEKVANILAALKKPSRDFNDYGQMTRFDEAKVKIIWNSKYVNEIRKIDVPTIFHKEGLVDKFSEEVLNEDYFGDIGTSDATANGNLYALEESDFQNAGETVHLIAGELIPTGTACPAGTYYRKDVNVIAKILVKLPPYMSAFEAGTEFFNPRSLTKTRYLTWGHNSIEYLAGYPYITLVEA